MDTPIGLLTIWVICIAVAELIAAGKGRNNVGLFWGLMLGPLGVILVMALPNEIKRRAAEEEKQRQLRLIALQEEQLRELRALRSPAAAPSAPAAPDPQPAPPVPAPLLEEFIPENLARARMSRRH